MLHVRAVCITHSVCVCACVCCRQSHASTQQVRCLEVKCTLQWCNRHWLNSCICRSYPADTAPSHSPLLLTCRHGYRLLIHLQASCLLQGVWRVLQRVVSCRLLALHLAHGALGDECVDVAVPGGVYLKPCRQQQLTYHISAYHSTMQHIQVMCICILVGSGAPVVGSSTCSMIPALSACV